MSELKRREALGLGAGLLGAGALASGGAYAAGRGASREAGGGSRPGEPVRIGYLPITDSAPLLLAHAKDLYAREGVQVAQPVLFRSWASLVEAFISGRVDVIHLLMPMAVYMRYDLGAQAKIVAWNHVNGSALTLAPHITDTAQLAGKTVAIPAWFSVHNILLQGLLRAAGLTPVIRSTASRDAGEVALVVMAPSDMIPALANGTISGFTVADPFNSAAQLQKVGRIHRFMGDIWKDHACCVTMMRQSLIDRQDGAGQAFTTALVGAQIFARENRAEAAGLLSSTYPPQKPAAIERAMTDHFADHRDIIKHPGWGGQLLDFLPYPYPSYTEKLVELMKETTVDAPLNFLEHLEPGAVHDDLVHPDFVLSALKQVGGPGTFGLKTSGNQRTEELDA